MKNNIEKAIYNLLDSIQSLGAVRSEASARTMLIQLGTIAEQAFEPNHPINTEIRELYAQALVAMANSLVISYDYANALDLCQEGFSLMSPDNPTYANSAYLLGTLYDHQLNFEAAHKFLKIAVEHINPDLELYLEAVQRCRQVEADLDAIISEEKNDSLVQSIAYH